MNMKLGSPLSDLETRGPSPSVPTRNQPLIHAPPQHLTPVFACKGYGLTTKSIFFRVQIGNPSPIECNA
jgi:hypothetical protein